MAKLYVTVTEQKNERIRSFSVMKKTVENRSTPRKKLVLMSLCPSQIPNGLAWG